MNAPREALDIAIDRASEIIWWNRSLTKLNAYDEFSNAEEFVYSDLVDTKGPYLEYVRTPKPYSMGVAEFLSSLGYHDRVIEATIEVLFDGDDSLPLYQHQAEMIEAIERDSNDNILAVPTATGKTESFFLPILNHCLQTDEPGLKSLIIYPMKTLEVDQFNRFIRYLDEINRNLADRNIKIGIWDGDTEDSTGTMDFQIEAGSYIRGLECPRTGEKLRVYSDFNVGTEDHDYPWIRVTRKGIRQGVDILLTNPEALDYIVVNDKKETRSVLGESPGEHPLKHIVYDEAHVWSGIKGASISLLSKRLKHFFKSRDPQVTMVSATVENPPELARALAGDRDAPVNSIGFTEEPVPLEGSSDFGRIKPCTLEEILRVLVRVDNGSADRAAISRDDPGLQHAVETLLEIDLLSESGGTLSIPSTVEQWLLPPIRHALTDKTDARETTLTHSDLIDDSDVLTHVTQRVLDSEKVAANWKNHTIEHIPEVAQIAHWFQEADGAQFRHYDELVSHVDSQWVSDPEGVVSTLMLFGRLGRILTDKYHMFLKPPSKAYWCADCDIVSPTEACRSCGAALPELNFCKTCHTPYYGKRLTDNETTFVPVQGEATNGCPGCGQDPDLQDINVPTQTLLSYMLTELCRNTPSKKTLVFSDSRSSAESVGGDIIDKEYGLVAETLYVRELLDNGGTKPAPELYFDVRDELIDHYWKPLKENAIDSEGATYQLLEELRQRIQQKASLFNTNHLILSALVTAEPVYQLADPDAMVIGHELYRILVSEGNPSFQESGVKVDGFTYSRMRSKLSRRLSYTEAEIDDVLPSLLTQFCVDHIISQAPQQEVEDDINSRAEKANADAVISHLEQEQTLLDGLEAFDRPPQSGVFRRDVKEDDSVVRLVPRVAYCTNCYTAYPSPADDNISSCPSCRTTVETYDRYTVIDGKYDGEGYAPIASDWKWAIDHWAHDIAGPANEDIEYISVGIHKGDIPSSLRGAIEEAFRKSDPDVNIVSATPTMELGVDIGTLETVTQVGIPPTLTNYVQRSGRTGRSQGDSSLVSTVVRGGHPVDNHYYAHLESFFSDFEKVRVPDPMEFDEILAAHVYTETLAYLCRNPDPKQVLQKVYTLNETSTDITTFEQQVRKRFTILRKFIDEPEVKADVVSHIESVFGQPGVDVFEQIFFGDGPLSLRKRVEDTFSTLSNVSGSSKAVTSLSENYRRLDRWSNLLGYLANYRSFGHQFPMHIKDKDEVKFNTPGRLFEAFPGEKNGPGSVFRLYGTKYVVTDVHGGPQALSQLTICTNEACERAYESYDADREQCPHCGQALEPIEVHPVGSVTCERARGGRSFWSTSPIMSVHVDKRVENDAEAIDASLFGLDIEVGVCEYDVVDFIYGFDRYHSRGSGKQTFRSQAVIEEPSDDDVDDEDASLDDLLDDVQEEVYRPIGNKYQTRGIELRFDAESIHERFEELADPKAGMTWSKATVSLEQAIEKAVAVIAECDRSDFRVKTTDTGSEFIIYIIDGQQGGNGIAWQVYQSLSEDSALEERVSEVASCTSCAGYCSDCLLLPRTPAHYLENGLLNKFALRALLGTQPDTVDDVTA